MPEGKAKGGFLRFLGGGYEARVRKLADYKREAAERAAARAENSGATPSPEEKPSPRGWVTLRRSRPHTRFPIRQSPPSICEARG
jgi:hypothetical protein